MIKKISDYNGDLDYLKRIGAYLKIQSQLLLKRTTTISAEVALNYALDHALERKSVVEEKELLTLGLKRGIGAFEPEALRKELSF